MVNIHIHQFWQARASCFEDPTAFYRVFRYDP